MCGCRMLFGTPALLHRARRNSAGVPNSILHPHIAYLVDFIPEIDGQTVEF